MLGDAGQGTRAPYWRPDLVGNVLKLHLQEVELLLDEAVRDLLLEADVDGGVDKQRDLLHIDAEDADCRVNFSVE